MKLSVKHHLFTLWHLKFFTTTAGNTIKRRNNHQVELLYSKKLNNPVTPKNLCFWSPTEVVTVVKLQCETELALSFLTLGVIACSSLQFSFTSSNPIRRITLNCFSPVPSTHNL